VQQSTLYGDTDERGPAARSDVRDRRRSVDPRHAMAEASRRNAGRGDRRLRRSALDRADDVARHCRHQVRRDAAQPGGGRGVADGEPGVGRPAGGARRPSHRAAAYGSDVARRRRAIACPAGRDLFADGQRPDHPRRGGGIDPVPVRYPVLGLGARAQRLQRDDRAGQTGAGPRRRPVDRRSARHGGGYAAGVSDRAAQRPALREILSAANV